MRQLRIIEKEEEEAEIKEKTLTGREKAEYVFGDFLRGFYFLGAIFFDAVVVGFSYMYIPNLQFYEGLSSTIFKINIVAIYIALLIVFLEIFLIIVEMKGFRKLFLREGHYL
ncbi:MAG: hypothetical protein ACP5UV_07060 [Thermoplasmata archaeon]